MALGSELGEFLHEGDEDVLNVHVDVEVRCRVKELLQRLQMKLVREGLDDALHQVLLRQCVLAHNYDFKDARQHDLLVDVVGDALETGQPNDILSDGNTQFIPLDFSLLSVLVRREVLQAHPEAVHLTHILEDELDGVVDVTTFALILIALIWQDIFHHFEQVVSEEKSTSRLLNTFDHIEQV